MRRLDERAIVEFKIPSLLLMENAGRSVAEEVLKTGAKKIAVICGKGNNGGDGFVAARHLYNHGREVEVTFIGEREKLKGDPLVNFEILEKMHVPIHIYNVKARFPLAPLVAAKSLPRPSDHARSGEVTSPLQILSSDCDLIVDAIFGTGLSKNVEEPYRTVIEEINRISAKEKTVVSVDIPSGLNADTGEVMGIAVRASITVTLACEKSGLRKGDGPKYTGRVVVGYISMPRNLLR